MPHSNWSNFVYSPVYTGYELLVKNASPIAYYSLNNIATSPGGYKAVVDSFSLPGSVGQCAYAQLTAAIMNKSVYSTSIYHTGSAPSSPLISVTAPITPRSAMSCVMWQNCTFSTQPGNYWQWYNVALGYGVGQSGQHNPFMFDSVNAGYAIDSNPGLHMFVVSVDAPATPTATTTTGRLYIDGVLHASSTTLAVNTASSINSQCYAFMNQPQAAFAFITQAISMHSIALNQTQITALLNAGLGT